MYYGHLWKFLLLIITWSSSSDASNFVYFAPNVGDSHLLYAERMITSLESASPNHTASVWAIHASNIRPFPNCHKQQRSNNNSLFHETPFLYDENVFQALSSIVFKALGAFEQIALMTQFATMWQAPTIHQLYESVDDQVRFREEKFDYAVGQFMDFTPIILCHIMNVKHYLWNMVGTYITDMNAMFVGVDRNPSYIPVAMSSYDDRMHFMQRVKNLLLYSMMEAEDRPVLDDVIYDTVDGIIVNGRYIIDFPRPLLHNIQYTGDLNVPKSNAGRLDQRLDDAWLNRLNDPKYRGMVILSFGTVANTTLMPEEMKIQIYQQLRQLTDYKVIWKLSKGTKLPIEVENDADSNVEIVEWLPQKELLKHKRCVCFITHGGFNSLLESAQAGVPLVMVPLFADQFGNALRAQRLNLGLVVQKTELELLAETVHLVVDNPSYVRSAHRLAAMNADSIGEPHIMLDIHIRWLTKSHRRKFYDTSKIARMPLYKFLCIDIIAFWSCMIIIVFFLCFRLGKLIVKKFVE